MPFDLEISPQIFQESKAQKYWFKNSDGKKIKIIINQLDKIDDIIVGTAFTTKRNTPVNIQGQIVFENNVTITFAEEGQKDVTCAGVIDKKSEKLFKLNGDQFSVEQPLKLQVRPLPCGNQKLDHIIYDFDRFIGFSEKSISIIDGKTTEIKTFEILPEEIKKVNKVHKVEFEGSLSVKSLIIEAEHQDGSSVIHILNSHCEPPYIYNQEFSLQGLSKLVTLTKTLVGVDSTGQLVKIEGFNRNKSDYLQLGADVKVSDIRIIKINCDQDRTLEVIQAEQQNQQIIRVGNTEHLSQSTRKQILSQIELSYQRDSLKNILVPFDKFQLYFVYLLDRKKLGIEKLEYCLQNSSSQEEQTTEFKIDEQELALAIEFLNTELKKIKFSILKKKLLRKNKSLDKILQLNDTNGYDLDLLMTLLAVNQKLIENKEYILAKAHDFKNSNLNQYKIFIDKFGIPTVIQLLQYIVQKSYKTHRQELKLKFDRLTSDVSLFEQLFKQTFEKSTKIFTCQSDDRPFRARLIGENSYDAGGPFRDITENICTDITNTWFKPVTNMDALDDVSGYQPKLLSSVYDLKRFLLIGKMIGWALQSHIYNLSLDLNIIFWKMLCNLEISIEDLKDVDIYRYQLLKQVLTDPNYEGTFEADLGDGVERELCDGGSKVSVTVENRQRFVQLYLQKYLEQDRNIYETIIFGVRQVARNQVLGLVTPKFGPTQAFSSPKISAEQMIAQTQIEDQESDRGKKILKMFNQMVRDFTDKERQLLLKFITGSSRLGPTRRITLNVEGYGDDENDSAYPVGHTCGESCDVQLYSSLEVMKEKFRTAILTCGEIDDDHNYYGSEDDGEEEDQGESGGEGEDSGQDGEGEDGGEDSDEESQNESQSRRSQTGDEESLDNNSGRNSNHTESRHPNSDSSNSQSDQYYNDLASYYDDDGNESGSDNNEANGESDESDESDERYQSEDSDDSESDSPNSSDSDSDTSKHPPEQEDEDEHEIESDSSVGHVDSDY